MSEPDPEIVQPDPGARRSATLVAIWLALAGALCVLALSRSEAEFQALMESWLPQLITHPWLPALMALLLASPVLYLALRLYRVGGRTLAAQRFPPPGLPVARPTPVVRGAAARRRGRWLEILSMLLVVAVGGMAITVWRVFQTLAGMS